MSSKKSNELLCRRMIADKDVGGKASDKDDHKKKHQEPQKPPEGKGNLDLNKINILLSYWRVLKQTRELPIFCITGKRDERKPSSTRVYPVLLLGTVGFVFALILIFPLVIYSVNLVRTDLENQIERAASNDCCGSLAEFQTYY